MTDNSSPWVPHTDGVAMPISVNPDAQVVYRTLSGNYGQERVRDIHWENVKEWCFPEDFNVRTAPCSDGADLVQMHQACMEELRDYVEPAAMGLLSLDVQVDGASDSHLLETFGEIDPHGLDQHAPGAKLDAGKCRAGLVINGFARALKAVADVGTYGANKYSDNGWMEVQDGQQRYTDAMYRHLLAEAQGELCDVDTGLLHAAHAAWNALARLDLMIRNPETLENAA